MNNILKRFLLFLVGCMGMRSLFVVIAKNISIKYLPILGYLALLPAIVLSIYLYIVQDRLG